MSTSVTTQATKVTFPNQITSMAGSLFAPPNMDNAKKYPALAVAHPFGGVKEQTAGIYARKMAENGYVTLAFDDSHQGESGGYPRDTENPAERMEDIRCAIDYLTTLPSVDEDRVGLLGVRQSCGSRLRDRRYDDSPQLFESHLARILVSF